MVSSKGRAAPSLPPARAVAALVATLLGGQAIAAAAAQVADVSGDAVPVVSSPPDLVAVEAALHGDTLVVSGVVVPGSGSLDGDFANGVTIVPGASARKLGPVYRVSLDLDRSPSTGYGGSEIEIDVTFFRDFPTGDPAHGVRLIEPRLSAFRRSYRSSGALDSSGPVDAAVERDGNGFALEVELQDIGTVEVLDLRVTAFLQWAGGTCRDGLDRPYVCFTVSDMAPDGSAAAIRIDRSSGDEVEVTSFDPEALVVAGDVDPQSLEVVYGPTGEKALLWRQAGAGSAGSEIRLQLFDATERPRFLPARVNQNPGSHALPTAAFDYVGDLLVFWREGDAAGAARPYQSRSTVAVGSSVLGRRFDKNGAAVGTELEVTAGGIEDGQAPAAATDARGNTVVTWRDADAVRLKLLRKERDCTGFCTQGLQDTDIQLDVAGQRAAVPQTAMSPFGDFVVVWQEKNGSATSVLSRRFLPDGTPKEAPRVVAEAGQPSSPAVAMNDQSELVIAWEADGPNGRDVFVRRHGADGTPLGSAARVNDSLGGDQRFPRVDANALGTFAVTWQDLGGASGRSVMGKVYRGDGRPRVAEFVVARSERGEDPGDPDVAISDSDELTFAFERRRAGGQPAGVFRRRAELRAVVAQNPPDCVASSTALCLGGGRFRVSALFDDADSGGELPASAVAVTGDTGYFWFFDPTNVEVVLKLLDGCAVNDRFWLFAAGLTDLPVRLLVEDVATGAARTYFGGGGPFESIRDTVAMAGCDVAASEPARDAAAAAVPPAAGTPARELPSSSPARAACAAGAQHLCLAASRFEVAVRFTTPGGPGGMANAVPLTADTGYFWFFDASNVEVIVKVLDACAINGRYWVFAAGLTDVEVELEVFDTETGAVRTYAGRQGQGFGPIQDTAAFGSCR